MRGIGRVFGGCRNVIAVLFFLLICVVPVFIGLSSILNPAPTAVPPPPTPTPVVTSLSNVSQHLHQRVTVEGTLRVSGNIGCQSENFPQKGRVLCSGLELYNQVRATLLS